MVVTATSPMQKFLWVFLDIKAILWYSGGKDGDVVIHLGGSA